MTRPEPSPTLIDRLLDVVEQDILPLTETGVAAGNKVFGAALLLKSTLELVLAETNNEQESPLWLRQLFFPVQSRRFSRQLCHSARS